MFACLGGLLLQTEEVWKAPSGPAVLAVGACEEGACQAGVLSSQGLGLKDPVPPRD